MKNMHTSRSHLQLWRPPQVFRWLSADVPRTSPSPPPAVGCVGSGLPSHSPATHTKEQKLELREAHLKTDFFPVFGAVF